jgi:hypothetical protein
MKKTYILLLLILTIATQAVAQERSVQNKPYIDLRPLHFGVLVGTHLQDVEFLNVGPQIITNDDGTSVEKTVTCDQVRWDAGFTVGVLAEARISENFAFRLAPAMYFGTRHFMFNNLTDKKEDGANLTEQQDLKSVYISAAADLIFAAKRFNNHRPYIMAGVNPMLNLSGSSQDYLQMKRMDLFFEVGLGCDFYLPFFKLRPELKFMLGLTNALDTKHADDLQDKTMRLYTNSVSEARSKIIALTFYFE